MKTQEPDESQLTLQFEKLFRQKSDNEGQPPRRGAHTICTGLLKAEFAVEPGLPDELKVGLFAESATFPALIRTSNSRIEGASHKVRDGRGCAIKLIGVPGKKCSADPRFQQTQDFVLLSIPASEIDTAGRFFHFMNGFFNMPRIGFAFKGLFNGNLLRLIRMVRKYKYDTSPLDIRYWSLTPYGYGDRAAKFSLLPTSPVKSEMPAPRTERYLTENMARHLASQEASFDFMVQFFQDEESTPIEDMSREWKESDAPFVKVATLRIPKQHIQSPERFAVAEELSFSPGHARVEHRPLGAINRVRIHVYDQLWKYRTLAAGKEGYEADLRLFHALS